VGGKADDKLVKLMQQDAVVRKVLLTYILQRVAAADFASAEPLLLAAKEARNRAVEQHPRASRTHPRLVTQALSSEQLWQSEGATAAARGMHAATVFTGSASHVRRRAADSLGPFAASLARQLAALSTAKKLVPESSMWKASVDGLLLRATAISADVHEEVRTRRSPGRARARLTAVSLLLPGAAACARSRQPAAGGVLGAAAGGDAEHHAQVAQADEA
jgi:hypothetical protein